MKHFRILGINFYFSKCFECPSDYLGFEFSAFKYPYFSAKLNRHLAETYIQIEGFELSNLLTLISTKTRKFHKVGFRVFGSKFLHLDLRNIQEWLKERHRKAMFCLAVNNQLRSRKRVGKKSLLSYSFKKQRRVM